MSRRERRTAAEWVTFAFSCLVLTVVVGLVTSQLFGSEDPAAPAVTETGPVESVEGQFHVRVTVDNGGDETAVNVQVTAELTIGDDTTTGDQVIDFLAGGETEELVFVFADDPSTGELVVEVTSFGEP
jgi:uncharacterized protein (TIGR02588 family)